MTKRDETLAMAELYRSGLTCQAIGDQYGISRQTVHQRLRSIGVTAADRPGSETNFADVEKARLESFYAQKITLVKIAKELNIEPARLRKALIFYAIPEREWIYRPGGRITDAQRSLKIGESYEIPHTGVKREYINHHSAAKRVGIKIKTERAGNKIVITRIL